MHCTSVTGNPRRSYVDNSKHVPESRGNAEAACQLHPPANVAVWLRRAGLVRLAARNASLLLVVLIGVVYRDVCIFASRPPARHCSNAAISSAQPAEKIPPDLPIRTLETVTIVIAVE